MARKRKDLRGLDPLTPAYWEEILRRQGLSIEAGRSNRLLYIGGPTEIEQLSGQLQTDTGRVVTQSKSE